MAMGYNPKHNCVTSLTSHNFQSKHHIQHYPFNLADKIYEEFLYRFENQACRISGHSVIESS